VKLSALAGKIGESIQGFHLQSLVLWFEDLLCGKHLNCRFEEEKTFLIWYVGGIERSPCVGRILQLWQHASLKLGVSLFHKPSSSSRTPSCWLLGRILVAGTYLLVAGPFFSQVRLPIACWVVLITKGGRFHCAGRILLCGGRVHKQQPILMCVDRISNGKVYPLQSCESLPQ